MSSLLLLFLAFFAGEVQSQGGADQVHVTEKKCFLLPIRVDEADRKRIQSIKLYVSRDEGKSWVVASEVGPIEKTFLYRAQEPGTYWFSVQTIGVSGERNPLNVRNNPPDLRVLVVDRKERRRVPSIKLLPPRPVAKPSSLSRREVSSASETRILKQVTVLRNALQQLQRRLDELEKGK
ncbi:MAG: hypothetical protein ACFCD0_07025 [Gemmataceae bacterium]